MTGADAVLERSEGLLLADEARHNLALGILSTARTHPSVYPELHGWIVRERDRVVLLGRNGGNGGEFGGAAYLRLLHGIEQGLPPEVDLEAERRLAALLRRLIVSGLVRTAHDLSEGGLAVALAEA